jgi:hypothetical protein
VVKNKVIIRYVPSPTARSLRGLLRSACAEARVAAIYSAKWTAARRQESQTRCLLSFTLPFRSVSSKLFSSSMGLQESALPIFSRSFECRKGRTRCGLLIAFKKVDQLATCILTLMLKMTYVVLHSVDKHSKSSPVRWGLFETLQKLRLWRNLRFLRS